MAYLNYFLQFKAFADKKPSNSPSLALANWVRDAQGVVVDNVATQFLTIPASGSVTVFTSAAKKLAYVEADAPLNLVINGSANLSIAPVVIGGSAQPGSFFINASLAALILTNPSSTDEVTVFVAHAE